MKVTHEGDDEGDDEGDAKTYKLSPSSPSPNKPLVVILAKGPEPRRRYPCF